MMGIASAVKKEENHLPSASICLSVVRFDPGPRARNILLLLSLLRALVTAQRQQDSSSNLIKRKQDFSSKHGKEHIA
eukprot:scaffold23976_cov76-Amphora_coffeaeformis.AAC.1